MYFRLRLCKLFLDMESEFIYLDDILVVSCETFERTFKYPT